MTTDEVKSLVLDTIDELDLDGIKEEFWLEVDIKVYSGRSRLLDSDRELEFHFPWLEGK